MGKQATVHISLLLVVCLFAQLTVSSGLPASATLLVPAQQQPTNKSQASNSSSQAKPPTSILMKLASVSSKSISGGNQSAVQTQAPLNSPAQEQKQHHQEAAIPVNRLLAALPFGISLRNLRELAIASAPEASSSSPSTSARFHQDSRPATRAQIDAPSNLPSTNNLNDPMDQDELKQPPLIGGGSRTKDSSPKSNSRVAPSVEWRAGAANSFDVDGHGGQEDSLWAMNLFRDLSLDGTDNLAHHQDASPASHTREAAAQAKLANDILASDGEEADEQEEDSSGLQNEDQKKASSYASNQIHSQGGNNSTGGDGKRRHSDDDFVNLSTRNHTRRRLSDDDDNDDNDDDDDSQDENADSGGQLINGRINSIQNQRQPSGSSTLTPALNSASSSSVKSDNRGNSNSQQQLNEFLIRTTRPRQRARATNVDLRTAAGYTHPSASHNLAPEPDGDHDHHVYSHGPRLGSSKVAASKIRSSPSNERQQKSASSNHASEAKTSKHHYGKYFQYSSSSQPNEWSFGYRRGNGQHTIERHEQAKEPATADSPSHFHSRVRWSDKYASGYGLHVWDYNHNDDHHRYQLDHHHAEPKHTWYRGPTNPSPSSSMKYHRSRH